MAKKPLRTGPSRHAQLVDEIERGRAERRLDDLGRSFKSAIDRIDSAAEAGDERYKKLTEATGQMASQALKPPSPPLASPTAPGIATFVGAKGAAFVRKQEPHKKANLKKARRGK